VDKLQDRTTASFGFEEKEASMTTAVRGKTGQETDIPKCYFCKTPVTEDEYCYGCGEYVCDDCGLSMNPPFGKHPVEAHQEDE
jgi:hypothetical protein